MKQSTAQYDTYSTHSSLILSCDSACRNFPVVPLLAIASFLESFKPILAKLLLINSLTSLYFEFDSKLCGRLD